MEAEEVAAMRPEGRTLPSARLHRLNDLEIAGQAVAMDGIEQQDVAVAAQATMAVEQPRLGRGEEGLA